jgi:hypothetical protein
MSSFYKRYLATMLPWNATQNPGCLVRLPKNPAEICPALGLTQLKMRRDLAVYAAQREFWMWLEGLVRDWIGPGWLHTSDNQTWLAGNVPFSNRWFSHVISTPLSLRISLDFRRLCLLFIERKRERETARRRAILMLEMLYTQARAAFHQERQHICDFQWTSLDDRSAPRALEANASSLSKACDMATGRTLVELVANQRQIQMCTDVHIVICGR